MSQPNTGPSDITIRVQDFAGAYTALTAYQGSKHETILLRSVDLKIDQENYARWLGDLSKE